MIWVKPLDPPHRGTEVFLAQVCAPSVVVIELWPISFRMARNGTPCIASHKPKVCRNIEGRIGLQVTSPHQRIE